MALSSILIVFAMLTAGLDPGVEALPCPNPVSAWVGTIGPVAEPLGVTLTREGTLVLAGWYYTGADLDPFEGSDVRETLDYTTDAYVLSVAADGSYEWAYTFGGGEGSDEATAVAIASTGEIIVVGSFRGWVDFDAGPGVDERYATGQTDAFIMWLDPDGTYQSTLTLGGNIDVLPRDLALDPDGNLLIVGYFSGTIDFDPGPEYDPRSGLADVFVSKLAPDGTHLWTNAIGGFPYYDSGRHIGTDSAGNVYATGTFRHTVDFDPGPGVDEHTTVGSNENLFVTKYHPDGSYAWTRTYDLEFLSPGRGLAVSDDGACLLTGSFLKTIDFDPGEDVDWRTPEDGSDPARIGDIFVTKLNADRSYAWTYTAGGVEGDSGGALRLGPSGTVIVAGHFRNSVDFDPGPGSDVHLAQGVEDVFVTKLSSQGHYLWTRTFGGSSNDWTTNVAVDELGSMFIAGSFRRSPDLDPSCESYIVQPHNEERVDSYLLNLACPELSADFDGNGVVDLRDAAEFQLCFTDEGPTTCGDGCSRLDLDPDDDIDLDDYTAFRKRLTGPQPRDLITPTSPITTHRERPLQE